MIVFIHDLYPYRSAIKVLLWRKRTKYCWSRCRCLKKESRLSVVCIAYAMFSFIRLWTQEQSEVEHDLKDAKKRIIRLQQELSLYGLSIKYASIGLFATLIQCWSFRKQKRAINTWTRGRNIELAKKVEKEGSRSCQQLSRMLGIDGTIQGKLTWRGTSFMH